MYAVRMKTCMLVAVRGEQQSTAPIARSMPRIHGSNDPPPCSPRAYTHTHAARCVLYHAA